MAAACRHASSALTNDCIQIPQQGDIEKVASRSPEGLTQLFEQISGSDGFKKPYEEAEEAKVGGVLHAWPHACMHACVHVLLCLCMHCNLACVLV